MSLLSPADNDATSVDSSSNGQGFSTAPSSVTSEPPLPMSGSPAFKAVDDAAGPRIRAESTGDEKLASRELQAPMPSDFPGKKPELSARKVVKGDFEMKDHFYERCCDLSIVCAYIVNAQIHPTVAGFFNLNRERMVQRYCHLHPAVSEDDLYAYLNYRPSHFHWAGSDLFVVTNANGLRQSIVIETNSCPSGQKSMPLLQDTDDYGGYRKVFFS
jgi:hypothetical protein